jgi:hypothetical protein
MTVGTVLLLLPGGIVAMALIVLLTFLSMGRMS